MQRDNGNHADETISPAGGQWPAAIGRLASESPAPAAGRTDGAGAPTAVRLSGGWIAGAWALVVGALALAGGGFVNSFSAVRDAVEPSFGELAWTIPVLIDVGIAVFSGIDLLFTRLDMRLPWLRLVPWALIGATIWLNVADEQTSIGVVAHAAPPVLWIVTVELAGHFLRARSGIEASPDGRRARGRMDRVRFRRWMMAPWSTLVIRRWMIMQEERSFERAYAQWWARKEAKWELQDTFGVLTWRVKAPRELRGRYRYGHLTPGTPEPSGHDAQAPERNRRGPANDHETEPRPANPHGRGGRRMHGGRPRADLEDVRATVDQLVAEDQPVNRTAVTQRLRARGLAVSNERADLLLDQLADEEGDPGARQVA